VRSRSVAQRRSILAIRRSLSWVVAEGTALACADTMTDRSWIPMYAVIPVEPERPPQPLPDPRRDPSPTWPHDPWPVPGPAPTPPKRDPQPEPEPPRIDPPSQPPEPGNPPPQIDPPAPDAPPEIIAQTVDDAARKV
jgi:hypothetical protein